MGAVINYVVAALPERRFCVPAPESHRSVASLCLSASWRSHIPFGRLFSCKGSRRANALHLFRTTGWENTPMLSKKVSFFLQDRNVPLTITTGTEKSICAKVFSPTYQVVTKKAKLAKDFPFTFQVVTDFRFCTKVFAFYPSTSLLARKNSKLPIFFLAFTHHLHLHPSIFLMATFLRLCTKLFSEQQKSLPSVSRKGLVTPYEARMRKQKTPHDNKTDLSVSFFIRCLGSLIRTNA